MKPRFPLPAVFAFFCAVLLSILLPWAAVFGAAPAANPPGLAPNERPFKVSRVGQLKVVETRDKLLMIFGNIQLHYGLNLENKLIETKLPAGNQYLSGKVLSIISPQEVVLMPETGGQGIYLKFAADKTVAAGDVLHVVTRNAPAYTYTAPGAEPVKLKGAWEVVLPFKMLTQDRFVAELKAGQTFRVEDKIMVPCLTCEGKGWTRKKDASGAESAGKEPCSTCAGKGEVLTKVTWVISW